MARKLSQDWYFSTMLDATHSGCDFTFVICAKAACFSVSLCVWYVLISFPLAATSSLYHGASCE